MSRGPRVSRLYHLSEINTTTSPRFEMLENWTGVVARRLLAKHIYSVLFKKTEANRSLLATNVGSELSRENAGFILYIVQPEEIAIQ